MVGEVARRGVPLLVLVVLGTAAALPSSAGAAPSTVWLCKPGLRGNPCTPGLSTTRFSPAGRRLGRENVRAVKNPKFDCFYVYPTVSGQSTVQANLQIDPEERSIALYQAARYSQYCRVYAPMYRQATLQSIGNPALLTPAVRAAVYADALNGWTTYLRKYNKGRGVVLIGHSQGTFVLRALIAAEIDPKPAIRGKLISALLLGGNVSVRKGKDVGGDFQHIRACHSTTQLQCVVAFSTFDAPVPADSKFGRTTTAGPALRPAQPALDRHQAARAHAPHRADDLDPRAPELPGPLLVRRRRERAPDQPLERRADAEGQPRPDLGPARDGREHRAGEPGRPRARAGRGVRAPAPGWLAVGRA